MHIQRLWLCLLENAQAAQCVTASLLDRLGDQRCVRAVVPPHLHPRKPLQQHSKVRNNVHELTPSTSSKVCANRQVLSHPHLSFAPLASLLPFCWRLVLHWCWCGSHISRNRKPCKSILFIGRKCQSFLHVAANTLHCNNNLGQEGMLTVGFDFVKSALWQHRL